MKDNEKKLISEAEGLIDVLEKDGHNISNEDFGKFVITVAEVLSDYREMLKKLEWLLDDEWEQCRCPICENWENQGHEADCQLYLLLNNK